jgi:chromosome partitioning protein
MTDHTSPGGMVSPLPPDDLEVEPDPSPPEADSDFVGTDHEVADVPSDAPSPPLTPTRQDVTEALPSDPSDTSYPPEHANAAGEAGERLRVADPAIPAAAPAPVAPAESGPTVVDDLPQVREAYPFPRIIAVANQKGGVGKTTTTVNMGAALAERDFRVLVVDLDPQGNATTGLGINYRVQDATMYDVLLSGTAIDESIEPTDVKGLFVASASLDLAGAEIELVPAFNRESKLKRALEEVREEYDFILIDCPPSLGLLTVNGLVAATEVMVPIQCEYYALEGLAQLTRNVELVRENLNPSLKISNIVMVMYDSRTKLGEQVVQEVRDHFGSKVCRNMIPRNVKLSEAPSFGQPITTYAPSSSGAVAYRELAREVSGGA